MNNLGVFFTGKWRWLVSESMKLEPEARVLIARIAGGVILLTIIIVSIQLVPIWQVGWTGIDSQSLGIDRRAKPAEVATLQNEMRKTDVQVVGGAFVLLALYLTYRRTIVTEQGHITDRYTKAIEQLGATRTVGDETRRNVEVRLGAIYALERIALDSPRDHWTIMEVLTAYVRENSPLPDAEIVGEEPRKARQREPSTEIQAILTVLGRRKRGKQREPRGDRLDLRKCDLSGANFSRAHLEKANFSKSRAAGAVFEKANLNQAIFQDAQLEGAVFVNAYLQEADLVGAHVERAIFRAAHIEGARFAHANAEGTIFNDAYLSRAHFRKTKGLNPGQLTEAKEWKGADYDEWLARELGLRVPAEKLQEKENIVPLSEGK